MGYVRIRCVPGRISWGLLSGLADLDLVLFPWYRPATLALGVGCGRRALTVAQSVWSRDGLVAA